MEGVSNLKPFIEVAGELFEVFLCHLLSLKASRIIGRDRFTKLLQVLTPEQHKAALRNEYNFDHPGKVDEGRIVLWSYPNEYLLQSFL